MVSSLLGKQNEWDIPKGISAKNLMTANDIRAWYSSGMEVGAHSLAYVDLLSCGYDDANYEIVQSKKQLESIIGDKVNSFSYPYGKYDKKIVQMVEQADYQTAVTTDRDAFVLRIVY